MLSIFSSNFSFFITRSLGPPPAHFSNTPLISPPHCVCFLSPSSCRSLSKPCYLAPLCMLFPLPGTYVLLFPPTVIHSLRLISDINACYMASFRLVLVFFLFFFRLAKGLFCLPFQKQKFDFIDF